jgi:hypothetical protein
LEYGPFRAPVLFHDGTSSLKSCRKICAKERPFSQYKAKELARGACEVVDQYIFGSSTKEDNAVCIASRTNYLLTRRNSRVAGRPEAIQCGVNCAKPVISILPN